MPTEILAAIIAALLGTSTGAMTGWIGHLRRRDDAATMALIELSASVKHIDSTLQRLERSSLAIQDKLEDHHVRISILENANGSPR
jgi:hypothetical protein